MKGFNFLTFGTSFLFLASLFSSCDKIEGDVYESTPFNPSDTITVNDTTTINDTTAVDTTIVELSYKRGIIIEDFTGHKCGNCPAAAAIISDLEKANENVSIIAFHVGSLADAAPPQAPKFSRNFKTTVGNDIDLHYGASLAGVPRTMVNRVEYQGSKIILPGNTSDAMNIVKDKGGVNIAISGGLVYDLSQNSLSANVTINTNAEIQEDISILLYVTQDSIISWQKIYSTAPVDGYGIGDIQDFVHMHAFVGSMNGQWGESINSSAGTAIPTDSRITKGGVFALDLNTHVPKHMNVVAMVINADTEEVLQVKELHLRDFL